MRIGLLAPVPGHFAPILFQVEEYYKEHSGTLLVRKKKHYKF